MNQNDWLNILGLTTPGEAPKPSGISFKDRRFSEPALFAFHLPVLSIPAYTRFWFLT